MPISTVRNSRKTAANTAEAIRVGAVERKAQAIEKMSAAASGAADAYETQRSEYESRLSELKNSYEKLENEITSGRTFFVRRILKAFPDFRSRYGEEIADRLREKLNIKK